MKKIQKQFSEKGYNLEKFEKSDSRRIGGDRNYKYYVAKDGIILAKLEDKEEAAEWIEFK